MIRRKYVIKKIVEARDAREAFRIEKDYPVEEVYLYQIEEPINNKVGYAPEKK